jgi:hypothetical protein
LQLRAGVFGFVFAFRGAAASIGSVPADVTRRVSYRHG